MGQGPGFGRIYISGEVDDLYGEYLFLLVELGLDVRDDQEVFVNLFCGSFGRPLIPAPR